MKGLSVGIIIQARVGSTRLPEKVLKPVYQNQSILNIILNRLSQTSYPLVLATSVAPQDDAIEVLAQKHGVNVFRGSEQNVLLRFVEAAQQQQFDYVVRVCADNPFLSLQKFEELMEYARDAQFDFDYLSFAYGPKPTILTHFGFFVELVRTEALQSALTLTTENLYLEHVTNYIYKHPAQFKVKLVDLPLDFVVDPNIRMTVDTPEDFKIACTLYQALMEKYQTVEIEAINRYLTNHPSVLTRMKHQIELNEK